MTSVLSLVEGLPGAVAGAGKRSVSLLPGIKSPFDDPDLRKYPSNGTFQVFTADALIRRIPARSRRSDCSPSKEGTAKPKSSSASVLATLIFPTFMTFFDSEDRQQTGKASMRSFFRGTMSRYREIKNATAEVIGVRLVKKRSTARAHEAIRDLIVANPTHSYRQLADLLGWFSLAGLPSGRGVRDQAERVTNFFCGDHSGRQRHLTPQHDVN